MWLMLLTFLLSVYIYLRLQIVYNYWITKGVVQLKPWPIVGNMSPVLFKTRSMLEFVQDIYNEFPENKYFGIYQFLKPTLVIRCPNLIKTILIKEFDIFPEHPLSLPADADPLFSNNLFTMRGGKRWHELRSILSASFTSSKLKNMFGLVEQCAIQCTTHFQKQNGSIIIEMKDAFSRYTNDVIGTTAFAVTCDSFKNPTNEFYLMGKDATNFTSWKTLKLFLSSISIWLVKIFKIRIVSPKTDRFFRSLIAENLRLRSEQKFTRMDMLNLLIEARKEKLLADEDITAHAFIFFLAGFDTSSTAMCFTAYELALNPDIQRKLQDEVDEIVESGGVTHERLLEMKYMDMVVAESLRKWPPTMFTNRNPVKPFVSELNNPKESLCLESETEVWIPIFGLHRDPKYYPEPDTFDPDRFSDDNRGSIDPFTYLPFGAGPRNCIGTRFAVMEVKLIIFYLLSKFDFIPTQRTPIPMVLDTNRLFPAARDGFWLELKSRVRN